MKLHPALLAAVVLTLATPTHATSGPTGTGALAVPANRIVGLWTGVGFVSPCGTPPPAQPTVRTTLLFNAGGTMTELPRFPPASASERTFALGTWSYDPLAGRYAARFRFDWYVNGVYNGYQIVEREMLLSNDGQQLAGPVRSTRYATDGSTISEVCGSGVSNRE